MARKRSADNRTISDDGYVLLWQPDNPSSDIRGYIYEHKFVMETILGRRILKTEHVHHIDENKQNNDPKNLEVVSKAYHRYLHRKSRSRLRLPGEENPEIVCGCGCGITMLKYDIVGRPRKFLSGHNMRKKWQLQLV